MTEPVNIGGRLKVVRKEYLKKTLQALADELGIPNYQTLWKYEADRAKPPYVYLRQLSNLSGVSIDWIVSGEGSPNSRRAVSELSEDVNVVKEAAADYRAQIDMLEKKIEVQDVRHGSNLQRLEQSHHDREVFLMDEIRFLRDRITALESRLSRYEPADEEEEL